MVTLATFSKPEEAHLFRIRLGAAGIDAHIQDEYMIQMDWMYSNAIGGVRVQVADEDLAAAREYLQAEEPLQSHEGNPVCPHCGSQETAPDEVPRRWAFLSMFLFNLPLPISHDRFRCQVCQRTFKAPLPPS